MNQTTPATRALARRLIAYEAGRVRSSRKKQTSTFPVTQKLRPHLTTLMGNGDYRALLMRALALAGAEIAWLRTLRVTADGTLEGLDHPVPPVGPGGILEGRVALMAQLLGLLVAFIGESLLLRLLREIWPRLPLGNPDFNKDANDEKQP